MKFLFFSLFFCIQLFAVDRLVVTGSSTIAPVLSDIAKSFEKKNSNYRIDVQTGGSSRGVNDARRELSDIGMVSRKLKPSEKDLQHFTIAKDGISLITHKSNPVATLTEDQVKKIYRAEIKNWKELGGNDASIVVVNKAEGRSTLELFLKYFKLKNSQIKASVVIGDNEQGIKAVAQNPNAIAYVSIGTAEYNQSVGTPIRLLDFKGVKASVENVENGSYPISRELNLVTKEVPDAKKKAFIDYALSKDAISIIREHYFVPVLKK
ncbi:MAG: phosphate ABC transporter substrate-binding protein [Bdellovibrionota bacterium]|nr:phosphate ABC transporter substrate-binding protein [Bdellovibrionota bacterium]